MLGCYLLMVISSHHKVTVERDEQRGEKKIVKHLQ